MLSSFMRLPVVYSPFFFFLLFLVVAFTQAVNQLKKLYDKKVRRTSEINVVIRWIMLLFSLTEKEAQAIDTLDALQPKGPVPNPAQVTEKDQLGRFGSPRDRQANHRH